MKLLSIVLISTAVSRSVPMGNELNKRDSHHGKENGKVGKGLDLEVGVYGAPEVEAYDKDKEEKKPEGKGKGYDTEPESNAYHVDKPVDVGYPTDEKKPQPAPAPVSYDEKPAPEPAPVTYDKKPESTPVGTYEKPAYPEQTADVLASSATSTIASMAVFAIALFM